MNDFKVRERDLEDFVHSPNGPVAQWLRHAAELIANTARATAPVREPGSTWSNRSTARRPGFLKEHIHTAQGFFPSGDIWTSANAPADPTIWLQKGSSRMHHSHPFMTEALLSTPIP